MVLSDGVISGGTSKVPRGTLLQEALRGTAGAATPRDASREVVKACVERLDADVGCAYMLDLGSGTFRQFVAWPQGPEDGLDVPAGQTPHHATGVATVADFLSAAPEFADVGNEYREIVPDGVVVFSLRGRSCVGAIRIDGPRLDAIGGEVVKDLIASANLLVTVFEDAFAFGLLTALQDPIDFGQSDGAFFRGIREVIWRSSGMEFAALREWDSEHGVLRCIALTGFGEDVDLADWDFRPEEDPAFEVALKEARTVAVSSMSDPEHRVLASRWWCQNVGSFVATPVRVGRDVFGVLSVAARCEFDYASIELRGFESIANSVGVAITNFRNSQILNRRVSENTAAALAMTSVDVARAARHEALNDVERCNNALSDFWKNTTEKQDFLDRISQDLRDVTNALGKIQAATKMPKSDWQSVQLKSVWVDAVDAVVGRLDKGRIAVATNGPDVELLAQPDWLKHVFFNLLLNSIDAFENAKKGQRRIELSIDRPSPSDNRYRVVYVDNAGGINPSRLRGDDDADGSVTQRVFEGGVTTKKEGSGYGLWLARKIVGEHYGSIDLVDYSGGIRFVVQLPTPAEVTKRKKREARL